MRMWAPQARSPRGGFGIFETIDAKMVASGAFSEWNVLFCVDKNMYLWPYDIPQFVNGGYLLVNAVILYW